MVSYVETINLDKLLYLAKQNFFVDAQIFWNFSEIYLMLMYLILQGINFHVVHQYKISGRNKLFRVIFYITIHSSTCFIDRKKNSY